MTGCFPIGGHCYCDCHNGLILNPKCYCTCRFRNVWNSSVNPPNETLSFCIHGIPTKFECAKCIMELPALSKIKEEKKEMIPLDILPILKQIDALETKTKTLGESACYADERIKELTSTITMGELDKRLHDLEQKYDHCQNGIDRCFEKVEDSLIKHKQNCEWLDKLDKSHTALTDMHKHLSIAVAALQDHYVRQIDENRKVSARLDMLADIIHSEEAVNIAQNDKITELETLIHDETHDRGNIWSRLEYLENFEDSIKKAPHPRLLDERLKNLESIRDSRIENNNGILYKCEECGIPLFEAMIKDIKLHNDFNVICHKCFFV
jgi:chromosome segregation ATPase